MLSAIPGKFLVIDDDESLRNLLEVILESAGAEVTCVSNGEVAISVMQSEGDSLSAVLIDLNLEDQPGEELLDKLQEINPEVAYFPMSGCFSEEIRSRLGKRSYAGIITKPFLSAGLISTLAEGVKSNTQQNASCQGI